MDKALKDKGLSTFTVDFEREQFKKELSRRALIKSYKQKISFVIGSIPMFKILQDISIAKALNPIAQLPESMDVYFGISMPAFVALHMVEHLLPPGVTRKSVQFTKVVAGIPFCVILECVDRVIGKGLEIANLPNPNLDMQGTLGVTSDQKLKNR